MVAHIVGGGSPWQLWPTCTLLFGGAVAAIFVRRRRLYRACLAAVVVGGVATIAIYVLVPGAPTAPSGLFLSIVAPTSGATVTSPVVLRVCAGGYGVPGVGRLLSISVDGRQVAEVNTDTAAITVASGEHTLRVELVTSAHREFAPPVLTDETINVSGIAPLEPPPDCPTAPAPTP